MKHARLFLAAAVAFIVFALMSCDGNMNLTGSLRFSNSRLSYN